MLFPNISKSYDSSKGARPPWKVGVQILQEQKTAREVLVAVPGENLPDARNTQTMN